MNAFKLLLSTWLILASAAYAGSSREPEIWISNHRLCRGTLHNSTPYVLLKPFKAYTHADIVVDAKGEVLVNGKRIDAPALKTPKGWEIPLQKTAEALHYKYRHNNETGIIDLFKEANLPPPPLALNKKNRPVMPDADTGPVRHINQSKEGERIEVADHLISGKTNIVCFLSQFCGVCRKMVPEIEQMVGRHSDLVLDEVDINRPGVEKIDWDSPVAQQYKIGYTPFFQIFDSGGNLTDEGEAASNRIERLLEEKSP